jgi:hypothetical protein
MGTLRTMEQDLAFRGIRPRTEHNYLRFVAGLTRHYRRAPDTLTLGEVEACREGRARGRGDAHRRQRA